MSPQCPRFALLLALLLVVGLAGCGRSSPTGPSASVPALAVLTESAHYLFRAAPGDTIDTAWQENYYAWATAALGVSPVRRITYNKYLSRDHMQQVVGVGNTNAFADRATFSIHTLWPIDNHEVVHLFTSDWGDPVALVNEGVAVAFQVDPSRDMTPRWSGTSLHTLARQFREQGRLVPIAQIVETAGWRAQDPNVVYPESGSFMQWLIEARGIDRVRALYARAAGPNESAAGVRASFAAVYGVSLDEAEQAWRATVLGS